MKRQIEGEKPLVKRKNVFTVAIAVVLVRPSRPGNIGAVARSMANFGCTELIIIDPQCNYLDEESVKRAKHGRLVLEHATVFPSLAMARCDWLVATSGKLGSDYNIPRLPLAPWQLAGRIAGVKKRKVGLVFGPEASGLRNEELESCDLFVSIRAHPDYPILNLSHAVTIVLYELFLANQTKPVRYTPASLQDKVVLKEQIEQTLSILPFETEEKRNTQRLLWQRIIGKSFLTRREAFALMGFFKKVLKRR